MHFLTAEFIVYCLFDVNFQAQLGEISQWHQHANGVKTLRTQDTSEQDILALVPKCLTDISAPVSNCPDI